LVSIRLLGHDIIGKEAIEASGFKFGRIDDILFDEKTWTILALRIKLEKDVAEKHNVRQRFRKSYVTVSISHVQAIGDRVLLRSSNEDIMKLNTYSDSAKKDSSSQPVSPFVSGRSQQTF
jgi:sporulation protein YlmC with PRC-barrel domain